MAHTSISTFTAHFSRVDMDDLVEKLLNSGNKVLEAAGKELPKWKKL